MLPLQSSKRRKGLLHEVRPDMMSGQMLKWVKHQAHIHIKGEYGISGPDHIILPDGLLHNSISPITNNIGASRVARGIRSQVEVSTLELKSLTFSSHWDFASPDRFRRRRHKV